MKASVGFAAEAALITTLVCGCASSRSSSPKGTDLSAYKYIVFGEAANDVYGVREELAKCLQEAGFLVPHNSGAPVIPPEESMYVLGCKWNYSATMEAATVTISLVDLFANKTVYSGEGLFGMGMNMKGDAIGAARRAVSGVKASYTGFNPGAVSKPKWEKVKTSEEEARAYLTAHKSELIPIEGIWVDSDNLYTIAILRENVASQHANRDFVGFVLSSRHPYWESGDVKLTGKVLANRRVCTLQYFAANKVPIGVTIGVESTSFSFKIQREDRVEETVTFLRAFPELSEVVERTRTSGSDSPPAASATGFFITDEGYLITNEHVARNATQVRLVTSAGLISAKVVKVDAANDLALLKAEGRFAPLPITPSRSSKLGSTVVTVGFPNIGLQGFAPKLAKGEIAALSGAQDDARYFQISVPVQPGNSGGALVDERGNVVGVVSAKLDAAAALSTSGALPENVNYAVKSSYLLSFLESVPDVASKLKAPETQERKSEEVVKSAEQAAVLVLVY